MTLTTFSSLTSPTVESSINSSFNLAKHRWSFACSLTTGCFSTYFSLVGNGLNSISSTKSLCCVLLRNRLFSPRHRHCCELSSKFSSNISHPSKKFTKLAYFIINLPIHFLNFILPSNSSKSIATLVGNNKEEILVNSQKNGKSHAGKSTSNSEAFLQALLSKLFCGWWQQPMAKK